MLETLSNYVDGELARELCAEIENHLTECTNCRVVVNTLRKTIEIVRLGEEGEELPEGVHQRLFACLHLPGSETAEEPTK
jgi:anti-sigma factor RsiW